MTPREKPWMRRERWIILACTVIVLLLVLANHVGRPIAGRVSFAKPSLSGTYKSLRVESIYLAALTVWVTGYGGGAYTGDTNPVDGLRFYFIGGNIAQGTFVLYGIKK